MWKDIMNKFEKIFYTFYTCMHICIDIYIHVMGIIVCPQIYVLKS